MGRREPPNIDEVGNLVLLRQALDVLGASGPEQLGLFPPGFRSVAARFRSGPGTIPARFRPGFVLIPARECTCVDGPSRNCVDVA